MTLHRVTSLGAPPYPEAPSGHSPAWPLPPKACWVLCGPFLCPGAPGAPRTYACPYPSSPPWVVPLLGLGLTPTRSVQPPAGYPREVPPPLQTAPPQVRPRLQPGHQQGSSRTPAPSCPSQAPHGVPRAVSCLCHLSSEHSHGLKSPAAPASWAPPQGDLSKMQMRCPPTREKSWRQGTKASGHSPHLSHVQVATSPTGCLMRSVPLRPGLCTRVCAHVWSSTPSSRNALPTAPAALPSH